MKPCGTSSGSRRLPHCCTKRMVVMSHRSTGTRSVRASTDRSVLLHPLRVSSQPVRVERPLICDDSSLSPSLTSPCTRHGSSLTAQRVHTITVRFCSQVKNGRVRGVRATRRERRATGVVSARAPVCNASTTVPLHRNRLLSRCATRHRSRHRSRFSSTRRRRCGTRNGASVVTRHTTDATAHSNGDGDRARP